MKYLSLFTGIGGFELGIGDRGECIGYSEINKHAIIIYSKHFNHTNYGDITKINENELPDFDLLVGGFPCQSFSIAGKRGGFSDTRGTLFFDIARILKTKKPKLLLLENVKGLLSHDEGRTFATIIATLDELGYDVQWQVLNSKDFGVPQNRERVLIVGHLRGEPRPQVFPLQGNNRKNIEARTDVEYQAQGIATRHLSQNGGLISDIASTIQTAEVPHVLVGTLRTHKDGEGFREMRNGISPTIPARARNDGSGQPVIIQKSRGKNSGGEHEIAPTITGKSYQDNNHLLSKTIRTGGRGSPHGSKQNWDSYEVGGVIRRLTPIECERLQGFPDGWTEGISDSQRYKCLGNAVTVNVIKAIIEKL